MNTPSGATSSSPTPSVVKLMSEMTTAIAIVPGMSLRDLHAPFYVALGGELCRSVAPGSDPSRSGQFSQPARGHV